MFHGPGIAVLIHPLLVLLAVAWDYYHLIPGISLIFDIKLLYLIELDCFQVVVPDMHDIDSEMGKPDSYVSHDIGDWVIPCQLAILTQTYARPVNGMLMQKTYCAL